MLYVASRNKKTKSERITVSIPNWLWKIINAEFKGKLGEGDSEIIRNIVIAYVSEHQKGRND